MSEQSDHGFYREIQAILTIYAGTVVGGFNMGYSAVAIPDILREFEEHPENTTQLFRPIHTNIDEMSWFASSVSIGQIVGGLLGGFSAGLIGPKRTILLGGLPHLAGWLTIALSSNIELLVVGRILTGMGSSIVSANCSMLVSQFCSSRRRGMFLSIYTLMVSIGILLIYCVGAVVQWRLVTAVPAVVIVVYSGGLFLLPESPIWLLGHAGEQEARKALVWLRATENVDQELEELRLTQEKQDQKLTFLDALRNFHRPDVHRPILLVLFFMLFLMFCGPLTIVFYAVQIFQSADVTIDDHLCAIILAAVRVLAGILAVYLVKTIPRLRLATISLVLMGLSMLLLGLGLYLRDAEYQYPGLQAVPLASLILYMMAFGAGAGPLQWVWLGELVPPEYKIFSGIINSTGTAAIFVTSKMFPGMLSLLQPCGTYWVYAGFCFLTLVILIWIPETKGLTLLQIRQLFKTDKQYKHTDKQYKAVQPV